MNATEIEDLQFNHFSTESHGSVGSLTVRMRGNADAQVQADLQTFLRHVDVDGKRLKVSEIVLDVKELYFMNSSCLSMLLRWITSLTSEELPPYKIRFVSNRNLRWQKRSFSTLELFGKKLVTVEYG